MHVGDILKAHPKAAEVLMSCGMHCLGCPSAQMESLKDACTGITTVEDDLRLFFGDAVPTKIHADMHVGDILKAHPKAAEVLMSCGMHCLGCPSAQMESLKDACMVHGLNIEDVLSMLND